MKFADLHIHSVYSDEHSTSKLPLWNMKLMTLEAIIKKAKEKKLSAIAVADHNNVEAFPILEKLAKKANIVVIPAIEISTKEGHLIGYGIKEKIPLGLTAQETIKEIHRLGGLAVSPHPFSFCGLTGFSSFKKRKNVSFLPLDGLEVVSHVTGISQKAKRLAKRQNLAMTGGSDAHCLSAIGFGLTVFPDYCETVKDYLTVLAERKTFTAKGKGFKVGLWLKTVIDGRLRPMLGI